MSDFEIGCAGDVVVGDIILFTEGVFSGSHRKPKHLGDREIIAKVLKDSYGEAKQQHTFTLQIIESAGTQPLEAGVEVRRKGRNIYRNGTFRKPWDDELARQQVCDEKHNRGDQARKARELRRGVR